MNVYATLLKEARAKNKISMDGLMEELGQKYGIKMTKQNYRRYENIESLPKKPDFLMLEKVFNILGLDTTVLPHVTKKPITSSSFSSEEKVVLLEKIVRLQDDNSLLQKAVETLKEKIDNLTGGKQ